MILTPHPTIPEMAHDFSGRDPRRAVPNLGPMHQEHRDHHRDARVAQFARELAAAGVTGERFGHDYVRALAAKGVEGGADPRELAAVITRAHSPRPAAEHARPAADVRICPVPTRAPDPNELVDAVEAFRGDVAAYGLEVDFFTAFACLNRGVTAEQYAATFG